MRRSRTVTSIIHTSEIYENSSTTCFSLYAFDGLVRRTLSQRRPCTARSTSGRFAAGPSGAERTWSTCSIFFFLKLALRKRSRPPPPQTNVLRFASFCELLRQPLAKHFRSLGLWITFRTNLKTVDFLDLMLDFTSEKHVPFRKPNDTQAYVHLSSNHPPVDFEQHPSIHQPPDHRRFQ